ncbi:LLM class flavin-dependent oxidoreductase [Actinokineospora globicatena]|uniref:Monooxygenase n=1 Tax=Actinokineospora globicatena TaxID=103729 RepID=A0A9W6V8J2_9PSEU|nr:LLM class flavin-dependent oxidoreductase [Actinokineospora globicatena]MCP2303446.1 limonene 1,2-monooxygenase [Actinokineospora globicatena]GLW79420.1 monooxygenase [Actinokineospora globicatena]GLW86170.1 monooxygenase [Actinokineospora globicatena]GLW90036.1 monooxygenase [Actinokineospora globicatena]
MRTGFGIFLSPLHDPRTDPHLNIHHDLELVELADRLNLDECWFGEHHSLGWPLVGAPETMIAAAATRTERIVLANGVVTVPFHHPFHIATRALMLDHLTKGRYILGLGPGATPNDAHMLGVPVDQLKPRTLAAIPTIIELVNGTRRVTDRTDWYDLVDARMQLPPHSPGGIRFAVSSVGSPFGPTVAAEFGMDLLSFGAPPPGWPGVDLAGQWRVAEEAAAARGTTVDRARWRVAVPIHIAETREKAFAEAEAGFGRWMHNYWGDAVGAPVTPGPSARADMLTAVAEKRAIIGSVEDAIEAIADLHERTGGFGTFLAYVMNWAPRSATKLCYELLATEVAPVFTGSTARGLDSIAWSQRWRAAKEADARATDAVPATVR